MDVFAVIREEPGNVSVKTIEREVFKLAAIRAVGLPDDLLAEVAPKVLAALRARSLPRPRPTCGPTRTTSR
ncbi:hypothetical protein ACFO8L_28935 [Sphaerisporangium corydalis]|uniref:Uncharacterized protein n=1 Tax=Sphaerisporangium corydalis TaxID=1441875 RepID=A0ABV9ENX9_9ACTN|nr:hypothetical protein [Sphaerisporangium corydalis]